MEAEALRLLAKIEDIGIVKAVTDNVIEQWCEDAEMDMMREMDDGERIVVGVNRFVKDTEPDPQRFTVDRWRIERHLKRFAETKAARDPHQLQRRMDDVYTCVRTGNEWHDTLVEAFPGRRHYRRGLGHGPGGGGLRLRRLQCPRVPLRPPWNRIRAALMTIRAVLGMIGADVHNKGLRTFARRLRDLGAEVIYLGDHNTAAQLAASAAAEDADVVGVSFGMAS